MTVLKNMKAFIAAQCQAGIGSHSRACIPAKDIKGATVYLNNYLWGTTTFLSTVICDTSGSNLYTGIQIGTSDTPVTENDYTLAEPITSGIPQTTASFTQTTFGDGVATVTAKFLLNNTSSADIVIKEIGEIINARAGTTPNQDLAAATYLMIWREVLSTPVTVPANGSVVLTVKRQVNLP